MNPDDAWDEIVALYADTSLARELLKRQGEEGLDVVFHLFTLWAQREGYALDATALTEASAQTANWHAQVIVPLRALRRTIKEMNIPPQLRASAHRQVQTAELEAERAQVAMLCTWLRSR